MIVGGILFVCISLSCCRYELYVKMVSQGLIQLEDQDNATKQSKELREERTTDAATADTGE